MQGTHSDLNLAVGTAAVAEHPRPDHLDSKPVHLLHQSPEEKFTLMPQTAHQERQQISEPSQAHKAVYHTPLLQRCSEVS